MRLKSKWNRRSFLGSVGVIAGLDAGAAQASCQKPGAGRERAG